MQLTPTLTGQTVQNQVREVGINPNYWYPVAWTHQIKVGTIVPVKVWEQAIAVFRDEQGQLHALEDACPHKGVALHQGEVQGDRLLCPYHGWEFNGSGDCVRIPYYPPEQKLPCAQARSYPAAEKYGIVWVFPGDPNLAQEIPLPDVPEYTDPDWLAVPIPGHFQAHFSICNENTMDVFHGFLHRDIQGWFDPELLDLQQTDSSVSAKYRISYRGWLTQFLGLSQDGSGTTTRVISVRYHYPHYFNALEGVSRMYLMRLPVGPSETRSFSLLFLKIRLPQWLVEPLRPLLARFIWHFLLKKFLDQDVEMMESEQQTYDKNRQRRYTEVNPAIIALQRVVVKQYAKFQQSSESTITSLSSSPREKPLTAIHQ
ncbi:MAG: aromatic ring-hydroxylating dioxygenase subunit alpha [Spirulina sp. SIO3F2]|nr:aromatic ring-hydroxylating dioxygenase subunit alpha [Spirulina sp. SIO3F2]